MAAIAGDADNAEVPDRYTAIANGFSARVDACNDQSWSRPTPCTEWTTRDILEHVVGVHRRVLALLHGRTAATLGPDDDPVAAWRDATSTLQAALRDPAEATRTLATPFGEMSFEYLVSHMICSDSLVHTWDLARATGQDEHLDSHAVEVAWSWMESAGDRLRASGDFGPPISPPPGADTQTRLLCFLGRDA